MKGALDMLMLYFMRHMRHAWKQRGDLEMLTLCTNAALLVKLTLLRSWRKVTRFSGIAYMRKQGQIEHRYSHLDDEGSYRYSHLDDDGIRHTKVCQGGAKLATFLYNTEGLYISFKEARLANACKKVNSNAREQPEANLPSSLKPVTSLSISGKLGSNSFGEDTIQIKKFVAEVITGKEKDVEDAGHHGLVDPTINTEEAALQDILSMFLKPLDIAKKYISKPSKRLVSVTAATSPPLFQGKRREVASPKGGNHQVQPLEIVVFKDDEQEQLSFLCFMMRARKRRLLLVACRHNRRGKACVYKDDEQEQVQSHSHRKSKVSLISIRKEGPLFWAVQIKGLCRRRGPGAASEFCNLPQ
ncbi:hypothetical protein GOP47_0030491 [Adiantum capillus-veneris]|nr:hypothetical protein GOP47_0030491 [Adiantum capillus-veneris]